jgi:hypothetical protein
MPQIKPFDEEGFALVTELYENFQKDVIQRSEFHSRSPDYVFYVINDFLYDLGFYGFRKLINSEAARAQISGRLLDEFSSIDVMSFFSGLAFTFFFRILLLFYIALFSHFLMPVYFLL